MPDDKTDPREANEDQAKVADSPKVEPNTANPDPNAQVGSDLDALLAENAEMRDRLLRTMADMENLRRRTEREKTDTARYAISNFARDVLTVGDKRIYFSGDTEAVPEMKALKNIDIAFVCMNLPYTMTPEEAAEGVKAFRPKVVYPYHYRGADLAVFQKALQGQSIDVRLREWYPQ